MNKNDLIEKRLQDAVKAVTPAYEESLYKTDVRAAEGDEWYLDGTQAAGKKKQTRFLTPALAMAFSVVLMFAGFQYYSAYFRTYATVYMDINPSLTLEINSKEKVKAVTAENEDAAVILEDLDLKDVNVQTAADAILGSMIRHGYIDEAHNMLLLSLECEDAGYASALQERLSQGMSAYLKAFVKNGCVLKQEITADPQTEDLAEKYGITPGKISLIQKAAANDPSLDIDELAKMPVSELIVYLHNSGFDLRPYSDEVEDLLEAYGYDDDPYEQYYEDEEPDDDDDDDSGAAVTPDGSHHDSDDYDYDDDHDDDGDDYDDLDDDDYYDDDD